MNDTQTAQLLSERPIVILPIGAVEAHGDHLPAGTDNILAARLTDRLIDRLGGKVPVLRLPLLPFGQVWSLGDAAASFGLSDRLITRIIVELGRDALERGLQTMVLVNAHLGNFSPIRNAQRLLKEDGLTLASFFYPGTRECIAEIRQTPEARSGYMHACEIETSLMLYLAPELVDMGKAISNYPVFPEIFSTTAMRWSEFSKSPVLGDPSAASPEKGRAIIEVAIESMVGSIVDLYHRQMENLPTG